RWKLAAAGTAAVLINAVAVSIGWTTWNDAMRMLRVQQAVSKDLNEAGEASARQDWNKAHEALARATGRLETFGARELYDEVMVRRADLAKRQAKAAYFTFRDHRKLPQATADARRELEKTPESATLYDSLAGNLYNQQRFAEAETA